MTDLATAAGAHLAWGAMNLVSANVSVVSAGAETVENLAHFRMNEAASTAWNGGIGYLASLTTAAGLALGVVHPVAPESLGMTEENWHLLGFTQHAIAHLEDWSENYQQLNVTQFLAAARVMTVACALSYANEAKAQETMGENSWNVKVVEHDNAQAMLLMSRDLNHGSRPVVILAFRGTELPDDDQTREFIPDWWRNLDFSLVNYDEDSGMVAKGFLEAWRGRDSSDMGLQGKIMEQLRSFSQQYGNSVVDVFVTGHSQGGALAGVALLDLLAAQHKAPIFFSVRGCMTLAQPKIGNDDHSDAVYEAVANAKIPDDLVANEDVTGVDPVVSLGGVETVTPAGRFWKVRVGKETTGPESPEEHEKIVEAPYHAVVRRMAVSAPLHWLGGRVGYLNALSN